MLTIDASVWMSASFPGEPEHAASRALVEHVAVHRVLVIVPTLLLVEVAGVFSRRRRDVAAAIDFTQALCALPTLRWVSLDESVEAAAVNVAAHQALRGADAVYATVVGVHGCVLVSLDHEHLTRLASGGIVVMTPADALARLMPPQQPANQP